MKIPRITNNDYESFKRDEKFLLIEYETKNGKGRMVVKQSYYNKFINKFTKLLKDCLITRMDFSYDPKPIADRNGMLYYG